MSAVAATVGGVLVIPTLLWLFYSAVRTEWPENYVSVSRDFGTVVNRTILRYLLFRTAPAYFAALIVATIVSRAGGNGMLAALVGGTIYVMRTQARHIVSVLRRQYGHRRLPILVVSVAAGSCVLIASFLGGLGPGPFEAVVPPVNELFNSLWSTILVALIAVAVFRLSRRQPPVAALIPRSRRETGQAVLDHARSIAVRYDADPLLVEAVLLTENLERPRWVRRLERLKARVSPAGSYGVMQVHADGPLTDQESIEIAVREYLVGQHVGLDEYGGPDSESLKRILHGYNPNANFVNLAESIYNEIYYERTQ